MALIGEIRKNKLLLVGTVGGALALFILMLMFGDGNPAQSLFGSSPTMMGEIAGKKLDVQEFNATHEIAYQGSDDAFSTRTALWNYFVEEAIINKEAEAIGLGVSGPELVNLQFSEDPNRLSPVVKNSYTNPNTRQIDVEQIRQLKDIVMNRRMKELIDANQLDASFPARWNHQEKVVIKDRLQTKLATMVSKGMYTPNWMAEMIAEDQNQKVDFFYVQVPFDAINNAEVTLEDKDYKAYFDENKNRYKQDEPTRRVGFVSFNVVPSAEDSSSFRKAIADLVPGFRDTKNDTQFIEANYGVFDGTYSKKADLAAAIADTAFTLPIGSVYGPYLDGNTYKAVKVLDRKVIPDSVSARHILRRAEDQASLIAAIQTIDSLKNLIETKGASFDSLAMALSQDQSNAPKGGDLGTFGPGTMAEQFNNVCFFEAETGKVYRVITQFGVHLVKVTDKKFVTNETSVKLAYLQQEIVPSEKTQTNTRELALQLQEQSKTLEDLTAAVAAKGLAVEYSPYFDANAFQIGSLGSGQGSRDLAQWAFGTGPGAKEPKVGQVSPDVYSFQNQGQFYVSKYAVAALSDTRPAGIPSFEDVKEQMEAAVINRKKAEIVGTRIAGKNDLFAVASTFSLQVDTAIAVSFASPFIQKAGGSEPKVVATAFKTDLNQVSGAIEGNTGVFVVKPTNKPAAAPGNLAQVKQVNQQSSRAVMNKTAILATIKKNADITDNRSKFF